MKRTLYSEEHLIFQDAVKTFIEREVTPNQEAWMEAGIVDRSAWKKAGEAGVLCPWLEEKYGGPGGDFFGAWPLRGDRSDRALQDWRCGGLLCGQRDRQTPPLPAPFTG